jgi:hypothetical protein
MCLHSTLGDEYAITSILKQNATLSDVIRDIKALGTNILLEKITEL